MGNTKYRFCIIRYIPNPVRGEFVNIGILIQPLDSEGMGALIRMTNDWSRVRRFFPDADVTMLAALEQNLRDQIIQNSGDASTVLRFLEECSLGIEATELHSGLAANLEARLQELIEVYVDDPSSLRPIPLDSAQ